MATSRLEENRWCFADGMSQVSDFQDVAVCTEVSELQHQGQLPGGSRNKDQLGSKNRVRMLQQKCCLGGETAPSLGLGHAEEDPGAKVEFSDLGLWAAGLVYAETTEQQGKRVLD